MSEDIVFVCRQCGGLIESCPDPPMEDRCAGGKLVCVDCGAISGIWLDAGMLDLGLIREGDLNPDSEFVIYS